LTPNSRSYLNRWLSPDSVIPDPGNPIDLDRYAYARNNPVKYSDSTGHFSENQIKKFLGLSKDDPWEEVLKLFEKGGRYAGRWGWLETLRRAELGDQITIDWIEGALPEGHPALDNPLTFGLDPQGNLILSGDGFFVGHEVAGLYGDKYDLNHYTDLSRVACSPYECGYTTNFSTSAIHDPYLHRKMEWEEFTNPIAVADLAKMAGITVFTGVMSVGGMAIVGGACTTEVACIVGLIFIGPPTVAGVYATYYLSQGTYEYFLNEFTRLTP
jgi:hypothetical protein